MSKQSSSPVLPRAPGGHEARLTFSEGVTIGRQVLVRELDPADDVVAHEVLTDIMAEHAAGTVTTCVHYRGKHPRRWFDQIYPPSCKPRVLGFFFPDDTLAGWLTVTVAPQLPGHAVIGMIVREPYRNQGLGTAALLHVEKHLATIARDPAITCVFFETQARNHRVVHVAKKLQVVPAGERPNPFAPAITMIQFTTRRC
jgi:RimJ/RimL family protein N-acetyltransferase